MTDKLSAAEANLRNLNNFGKKQNNPTSGGNKLVMTQEMEDFLYGEDEPPKPKSKYSNLKGFLNDPMSPYTLPETPAKFKNLADVVNNKQYAGIYNQSAAPLADYFTSNNIDPFYYIQEWDDECRGNMTIKLMIYLTAQNQPWALERDQDIDEILYISRAYLNQLNAFRDQIKDSYVLNSLRMTEKFVEYMERKSRVYHTKVRPQHPTVDRSITDILKNLIG